MTLLFVSAVSNVYLERRVRRRLQCSVDATAATHIDLQNVRHCVTAGALIALCCVVSQLEWCRLTCESVWCSTVCCSAGRQQQQQQQQQRRFRVVDECCCKQVSAACHSKAHPPLPVTATLHATLSLSLTAAMLQLLTLNAADAHKMCSLHAASHHITRHRRDHGVWTLRNLHRGLFQKPTSNIRYSVLNIIACD